MGSICGLKQIIILKESENLVYEPNLKKESRPGSDLALNISKSGGTMLVKMWVLKAWTYMAAPNTQP